MGWVAKRKKPLPHRAHYLERLIAISAWFNACGQGVASCAFGTQPAGLATNV